MITFDNFSPEAGTPIYLQIVTHIKRGIVSGAVRNGDELPSRRVLSALLGVNPNTIQKAYKELENENYIYSIRAKGYFVSDVKNINPNNIELLKENLKEILNELYFLGEDYSKITDMVDGIYKGKE